MRKLFCACACGVLGVSTVMAFSRSPAQQLGAPSQATVVSDGWHPWYEIKADPEDPRLLIICGTKWDPRANSFLGFVYSSPDGGESWRRVLEDRSSSWVSEQSCAFGANHRAYFVSEASRVIDGEAHHELGITRLFTSTDSGQHWTQTLETGWADFSTSAVSRKSGRLYTFFHSSSTLDPSRKRGSNVGLLIFSADGKSVRGPIFDESIQALNYRGAYPSDAIALKSGAVVALYQSMDASETAGHLAIIRADESANPKLETHMISQTRLSKDCESLDRGSLAYDSERDRLFVLYGDGCRKGSVILASSDDEGRTWTMGVPIAKIEKEEDAIVCPSLVVGKDGALGLLWEQGWFSGRWMFSQILDQKLAPAPLQLSRGVSKLEIGHDSLWLQIAQPDTRMAGYFRMRSSITLRLVGILNDVWREEGVIAVGNNLLAVWSSGDSKGMSLHSQKFTRLGSGTNQENTIRKGPKATDVTSQTAILFGEMPRFDRTTGTLQLCLSLHNNSSEAFKEPIELRATEIKSSVGSISILNASNRLPGAGATWNIDNSITGDRIPPRSTSNPVCLAFHLEVSPELSASPRLPDLLTLRLSVLADQ